MNQEEILPDSKINPLFIERDLVGSRTPRSMVNNSLCKKVAGYWSGSTMYHMIVGLDLWDDKKQCLTEFGYKYFVSIQDKRIISHH